MGERLSYDQLIVALSFLAACAISITLFTEWVLRAVERKRTEIEEKEYWLAHWQFPGPWHLSFLFSLIPSSVYW